MQLLSQVTPFNSGKKTAEIEALLEKYIPSVEKMKTRLKKYSGAYKQLKAENAELEQALDSASRKSVKEQLEIAQKLSDYDTLRRNLENIPPEILDAYAQKSRLTPTLRNNERE